ncbi:MAG: hypothetical protein AAF211_07450 [Myxococcota bacterium]
MQPADLEAHLLDHLDDPEAWAVYADWLEGQGTPRGKLAGVQRQLAATPTDALREAEATLLSEHPELAPRRMVAEIARWRADEPDRDRVYQRVEWQDLEPRLDWSHGHIVGARLAKADPEDESIELVDLVREVLHHDAARLLQRLVIGPLGVYDEYDYTGVVAEIANARLPALRELVVAEYSSGHSELSWGHLGNLTQVWKVTPRLERAVVRAGHFELGRLIVPRVRSFRVETGGLGSANLESILTADWPALEALEIWFGDEGYGAGGTIDHVRRVLAFDRMPNVVELGLKNAEFTDAIVGAVVAAPTRTRLRRLDLSLGTLTSEGATALAEAGAEAFPALRTLSVAQSYVGEAALEALRDAFPDVAIDADGQEQPDEYDGEQHYYVSVSE